MSIDIIIANTIQYDCLHRVEPSLNFKGLTFCDLNDFQKAGTYTYGNIDIIFKNKFGYSIQPPKIQYHCLCGHSIKQQCYKCPEGSTNVDDSITVGNHCIKEMVI